MLRDTTAEFLIMSAESDEAFPGYTAVFALYWSDCGPTMGSNQMRLRCRDRCFRKSIRVACGSSFKNKYNTLTVFLMVKVIYTLAEIRCSADGRSWWYLAIQVSLWCIAFHPPMLYNPKMWMHFLNICSDDNNVFVVFGVFDNNKILSRMNHRPSTKPSFFFVRYNYYQFTQQYDAEERDYNRTQQ